MSMFMSMAVCLLLSMSFSVSTPMSELMSVLIYLCAYLYPSFWLCMCVLCLYMFSYLRYILVDTSLSVYVCVYV